MESICNKLTKQQKAGKLSLKNNNNSNDTHKEKWVPVHEDYKNYL